MKIVRYTESHKEAWNAFNAAAKNGLFIFDRAYMDYHADRFADHSLLFFEEEELVAMLPANEAEGVLQSHGGLTFGGFLLQEGAKQHLVLECFDALFAYARECGIREILYKAIPHVLHKYPAEEDLYALFLHKALQEKVEAATVLDLRAPLKMPKGRKAQISRAKREGVVVAEMTDAQSFRDFIDLENEVLRTYHDARAVHTAEELFLLKTRFPEQIRLYGATWEGALVAGAVIYEYGDTVHTQYLAAGEDGRRIGALDLVVRTIMDTYATSKRWLDFGKSTEANGEILNTGLIAQKEGFGGRTNVYTTWRLSVCKEGPDTVR